MKAKQRLCRAVLTLGHWAKRAFHTRCRKARAAHMKAKQKLYDQALATLKEAKEQYIKGFSEGHPKVITRDDHASSATDLPY